MAGIRRLERWHTSTEPLDALRSVFTYDSGDDRATGTIYAFGGVPWRAAFETIGPELLEALHETLGVRFTIVAFQAYRDGAGCGWHSDDPFDAQAVLSLGMPRTFGVRPIGGQPIWMTVNHGDLIDMPPGTQLTHEHCIPIEPVIGERCALVFRTPRG